MASFNENTSHLTPGYAFYHSMGCPKKFVAPMVDQCELAYRMMTRKHGAECVYTQMFSANSFSESEEFRRQHLVTCPEDRPLIVQLSGHDPQKMLASALYIQSGKYGVADAVDINIGCPQNIAKRGRYGAFLMEELELLEEMVSLMTANLTTLPVTCKSRIYKDENGEIDMPRTVRLYETLINAGAKMITVHCRTRDEKGFLVAAADWRAVARLVEYFDHRVPIVANGGIETLDDYYECLRVTGADGVMSAEGVLENPALFAEPGADGDADIVVRGRRFPDAIGGSRGLGDFPMRQLLLTREYLAFCRLYDYQHAALMRSHVIKMLYRYTCNFRQLTDFIIKAMTVDEYVCVLELVEEVVVQTCMKQLTGGAPEVRVEERFLNPEARRKDLVYDFARMAAELKELGQARRAALEEEARAGGEAAVRAQHAKMDEFYRDLFHVTWYNRHRDPSSRTAPENRPTAEEALHKHFKSRNDSAFFSSAVEEPAELRGEEDGPEECGEGADGSLFAIFGMSDAYC